MRSSSRFRAQAHRRSYRIGSWFVSHDSAGNTCRDGDCFLPIQILFPAVRLVAPSSKATPTPRRGTYPDRLTPPEVHDRVRRRRDRREPDTEREFVLGDRWQDVSDYPGKSTFRVRQGRSR